MICKEEKRSFHGGVAPDGVKLTHQRLRELRMLAHKETGSPVARLLPSSCHMCSLTAVLDFMLFYHRINYWIL